MISVADRLYFKDFKNHEPLLITGLQNPITIQPTLSKLEGEYTVTIAKKSLVSNYEIKLTRGSGKNDSVIEIKPYLIGMATEMHALYNVIMPPGITSVL